MRMLNRDMDIDFIYIYVIYLDREEKEISCFLLAADGRLINNNRASLSSFNSFDFPRRLVSFFLFLIHIMFPLIRSMIFNNNNNNNKNNCGQIVVAIYSF